MSLDDGWDSEGWSERGQLTPYEQEELRHLFEARVPYEQAERSDREKPQPRAFDLCPRLAEAFEERAREEGFKSWQEWLRAVGEKEASRARKQGA